MDITPMQGVAFTIQLHHYVQSATKKQVEAPATKAIQVGFHTTERNK